MVALASGPNCEDHTMITKITAAYIRYYRDNCQLSAYVEWIDSKGKTGRTESKAERIGDSHYYVGQHMGALLERAHREGIAIEKQTW